MNLRIEILAVLIFCGCSNLSPNEGQIKKSLSNLSCYQELIEEVKNNDQFREEIINIRESKKRGDFDPITVKQEFRLIGINEIIEQLNTNWVTECKYKIEEENDFRGIRVIDENLIIIEIDEFDRYTLTKQYSKERTVEFHRLIITDKPIDNSNYYFGTERRVWQDTIEKNWIYEVTQLKI